MEPPYSHWNYRAPNRTPHEERPVRIHNVFELGTVVPRESLFYPLSLDHRLYLENIVHFYELNCSAARPWSMRLQLRPGTDIPISRGTAVLHAKMQKSFNSQKSGQRDSLISPLSLDRLTNLKLTLPFDVASPGIPRTGDLQQRP